MYLLGVSAPLVVQAGGLAPLERNFQAGMSGENEKQQAQAPEQISPGCR